VLASLFASGTSAGGIVIVGSSARGTHWIAATSAARGRPCNIVARYTGMTRSNVGYG
jgi:hypothetical protein